MWKKSTKGVPSESYTRYAQASDEMREAIGLRALLRSTEFLGIFMEETAGDFFSMRVARQLSCDPRNQGIYAYIYIHIYTREVWTPKHVFWRKMLMRLVWLWFYPVDGTPTVSWWSYNANQRYKKISTHCDKGPHAGHFRELDKGTEKTRGLKSHSSYSLKLPHFLGFMVPIGSTFAAILDLNCEIFRCNFCSALGQW